MDEYLGKKHHKQGIILIILIPPMSQLQQQKYFPLKWPLSPFPMLLGVKKCHIYKQNNHIFEIFSKKGKNIL